jgi:N-acetyl-gamma-glutamyl-phosphate reductase
LTLRVGIAGATGYSGVELVRLLSHHPRVQIVLVGADSQAGQPLDRVHPHLSGLTGLQAQTLTAEQLAAECDVVFTALPHGHAMALAGPILSARRTLVDLGADFRLRDPETFTAWYRQPHTAPQLLDQAVYGLPELFRDRIPGRRLIANPGCYPTSCALAAAPLLREKLVRTRGIVFDSKSGVSGAGRGLALGVHYAEVNESFKAYSIAGTHRHTPEIEQTLGDLAGLPITVSFTPHLVPMTRGILTTAYFDLERDLTTEQAVELFRDAYAHEPFIRVRPVGDLPATKHVTGSNRCDLGVQVDARTGKVVVISVIDNLVKGAAGQAVQNMNLALGLPETMGLESANPLFP